MRWSYKTVHYELKKEGLLGSAFLDESEVEVSLNEYGKAGWELVSMLETLDGLIAVFKQPLTLGREEGFARPVTSTAAPLVEEQRETPVTAPVEKKSDYVAAPTNQEDSFRAEPVDSDQEEFAVLDEYEIPETAETGDPVEVRHNEPLDEQVDVGTIRIE